MISIQQQIEDFLLQAGDNWTPGEVIAARFAISDRNFRADGKQPGLLSKIAIFNGTGFKHLRYASFKERLACRHRLKKEIVSRFRRLRWLDEGTRNVMAGEFERHTGQGTFL